jgi:uncharacterized protein (TIGR02466 family)
MQHLRLFPTNVGVFDIDDAESLNKELEKLEFLYDGSYRFISRKNIWDLADEHSAIKRLKDIVLDSVVKYAEQYHEYEYKQDYFTMPEGWVECSNPGEYNLFAHNHRLTHIACVYYMSCDDNTGNLDLIDPRGSLGYISLNNQASYNVFSFKPKVGQLLLFPGWLTHYVHPNKGETTRKIIATNVKLREDVTFAPKGPQRISNVSSLKI